MVMDDDGYVIVNPGFKKPKFSKKEVRETAIAILVLSVAFFILYARSGSKGILRYLNYLGFDGNTGYVVLFSMALILVVLSFLLHEYGHKFTAQKFGMWSEFRLSVTGLVITLATSCLGFLFAAPGAVMISGNMDAKRNGLVSIAGPAVNIGLAIIAIACCFAFNHSGWVLFFNMLASLNVFLAFFNLLPIGPLDGAKIMKWNMVVWIATFAVSIVLLLYTRMWMPDLYIT